MRVEGQLIGPYPPPTTQASLLIALSTCRTKPDMARPEGGEPDLMQKKKKSFTKLDCLFARGNGGSFCPVFPRHLLKSGWGDFGECGLYRFIVS